MQTLSRRAATGLISAFAVAPAMAQPKQVTVVVPFPPGGSTDALARLVQAGLQQRLGATVVIENKPGGVGSIGAAQVARAAPDGATFLLTFDSHAVIPALIEKPAVNVETDLIPVMLIGTAPYVIATNAGRPFKTFADVIAAAKQAPGKVNFASVGVGTIGHLAMTLLSKLGGVEITHIPYKGGGPAINDVVGGHVDLIAGSAALILPHLSGGKIRPVMQLGKARLPALPDTPTAMESGFADFEAVAWWGVFAPKGTPADGVVRLVAALSETLKQPDISKTLVETQQIDLQVGGPEKLQPFFDGQLKHWGKVVRDNGIKSD
jgi:tripartite-type tricarboxylate transporter receptor subunit TctC